MNIRKNIDYTDMYAALDSAMEKNLSQVELYYEIGRAVCQRTEKGAAVAAATYLSEQYPDIQGFSPRNLRRMRNFYCTYGDNPRVLSSALQLGWTQNVVILEADLSLELREWYLLSTSRYGWSKAEIIKKIADNAHEVISLVINEGVRHIEEQEEVADQEKGSGCLRKENKIPYQIQKVRCRMQSRRWNRRRWPHNIMPKNAEMLFTQWYRWSKASSSYGQGVIGDFPIRIAFWLRIIERCKQYLNSCTFICNKHWICNYL